MFVCPVRLREGADVLLSRGGPTVGQISDIADFERRGGDAGVGAPESPVPRIVVLCEREESASESHGRHCGEGEIRWDIQAKMGSI